jgi:Outer membrane protein beta-barrel domain
MKNRSARSRISFRSMLAPAALLLCSLGTATAAHGNPLGLYIGAAYGEAHVRARLEGLSGASGSLGSLGEFDNTNSAFQAMLGIRPISLLGAEVIYVDLGGPSVHGPGVPVPGLPGFVTEEKVSQKGAAAFGMLYLPVPVIDIYLKAGVAHITSDMTATANLTGVGTCAVDNPNCGVGYYSRSRSDTNFAYGAGVQWKLGQWAVRGEYERFEAAGAYPSVLSIGMTYWLP